MTSLNPTLLSTISLQLQHRRVAQRNMTPGTCLHGHAMLVCFFLGGGGGGVVGVVFDIAQDEKGTEIKIMLKRRGGGGVVRGGGSGDCYCTRR